MRLLRRLRSRLAWLFHREAQEQALSDDLQSYLTLAIEDKRRAGLSPEEARRQALAEFGPEQVKERVRDVTLGTLLQSVPQDVRFAFRVLNKSRSFTLVAVLSLALGIGVNTMIFSLVNAILLRPLPYADPDRLVMVWFTPPNRPAPNEPGGRVGATRRNCYELRARSRMLDISCFQYFAANLGEDQVVGASATERIEGEQFTADFSRMIGVNPLLGRWFTQDEEQFDAEPVIVLSYDQWQRRFNGSKDVVGTKVRVDGVVTTLIGVMPQGFEFLSDGNDYWSPFRNNPTAANSPVRFLQLPARLRSGFTLEQAQSEMNAIGAALTQEFPVTNKDWGIRLEPLRATLSSAAEKPLMTLEGAVVFVLLIACANVAGLLLARGIAQGKELAIRTALGASRWRIVRQLLTLSIVLSLAGGVLGLFIGWAGVRLIADTFPRINPLDTSLDIRMLGFAFLLSVVTGLAFGIVPALQASSGNIVNSLKENSRSATSTRSQQNLRSAFVVIQLALAFVLLVAAGLMIKTFLHFDGVDFGFDHRNLMTFQIQFPRADFRKSTLLPNGGVAQDVSPRLNLISAEIRDRLAAISGVEAATATVSPPLAGFFSRYNFTIVGRQVSPSQDAALSAQWSAIWPEYFETLRIPILRGRSLTHQDAPNSTPVIAISETMGRTFWPNEDPIGERIQTDLFNDPPREIVGIVGDIRQAVRQEESQPQMYIPYAQMPSIQGGQGYMVVTFVTRSNMNAEQLVPALRSAVAEVDRSQAMDSIRTVDEYAQNELLDARTFLKLFTAFGGIALLLAIVGIYGVVAHSTSQRTAEIGVRIALGARGLDVLRLVLMRGLVLIALGLLIGCGLALATTRLIRAVLWGVTPNDPETFVVAVIALSAAAAFACYVPARRALRVDPSLALRAE